MNKVIAKPGAIRLNFRSEERIVIEPDNKDLFVVTMREAASACSQAQDEKEFAVEFDRFLFHVHQWCEAHADRVQSGCIAIGDGVLNIFIRTKRDRFDFEFDETLSGLDIELVQEFPWLRGDVLQVPASAREDQALSQTAILVYGDGSAAPRTS